MPTAKVDLTKRPLTIRDENKAPRRLSPNTQRSAWAQGKGTAPVPVGKSRAGLPSSQRAQRTGMFPRKGTRGGD